MQTKDREVNCKIFQLLETTKKANEAIALVTEESTKFKVTKEVIKSQSAQDRLDQIDIRLSNSRVPPYVDLIKQLNREVAKQGKIYEEFSLV